MHSSRTGCVARTSIARPAISAPAVSGRSVGSADTTWFGQIVRGLLEPERRQAGEHATLVGDLVGQHDVEHRDAVRRDHQHPVVRHLVEVAHLAPCSGAAAPDGVIARARPGSSPRAPVTRHPVVERVDRGRPAVAFARSKHASRVASSSTAVTSGSSAEHVAERPLGLPRPHRVALHRAGTRRHGRARAPPARAAPAG